MLGNWPSELMSQHARPILSSLTEHQRCGALHGSHWQTVGTACDLVDQEGERREPLPEEALVGGVELTEMGQLVDQPRVQRVTSPVDLVDDHRANVVGVTSQLEPLIQLVGDTPKLGQLRQDWLELGTALRGVLGVEAEEGLDEESGADRHRVGDVQFEPLAAIQRHVSHPPARSVIHGLSVSSSGS